jgi:lipopolysaccharide assembly outer membrane protein LptD (OstA)
MFLVATALLTAQEQTGSSETAPEAAVNLIEETLGSDIDTASYYELVAWCRDLGLSDAGTRQALQKRLYGYYKISPPGKVEVEGRKRLLEIKSAKETQYFTIEEIDENYVLLLGDVLVEIQEEEATHRIRAHRILLNQTENILSAEGGIEYTLIKGTEEEVFRGERLTFDVDSWEGVFFGGGMEADRVVSGETIRFRFFGESISRLDNNTVVMDRGRITTCDVTDDPHYHIRARKIWVLAPNEWAILHAVLYVGNIPLLYLPFFFHPGDEFFFHPAIGYRDREGNFIQTTIYLIGQKKRSSSALSFLAATEQSTTQYEVERRGLFLRQLGDKPIQVDENRFLKLMFDIYSRLGGFAGIEGNFPPKINFKGGVGISRTIYFSEIEPGRFAYTPLIEDGGAYRSSWNESYLFGISLPLRFGLESSWSLGSGGYRFTGKFEYFSDPFFSSDFYDRAEDTGLTRLIGIEPIVESTGEGERRNLTWELSGQTDFSGNIDTPLIKTLSFPYIKANLYWQSRENNLLHITRPSVEKAGKSESSILPAELRSPDGLEADHLPKGTAERRPTIAEPKPPLELFALRPPRPQANVPVSLQKTPLQFRLSYQVRPNVTVEQSFNADDWQEPEDVTYDLKYTSLDTSGISSLDYSLRILENVLSLSGNFALTGNYRSRYRQSFPTGTEWDNLVRGDQEYTQLNVKSTFGLDYYPFADNPIFGSTSLNYDLSWIFFRYIRDPASSVDDPLYFTPPPEWSPDTVSQHNAQAALKWRMFDAENTLSLAAQLPPRAGSLTGKLEFTVWLLTTTVNSVFKDVGGTGNEWSDWSDWSFQPLVVRETLRLGESVNLSEELRFDLQSAAGSGLLTKSLTSMNLWNLHGSFSMDYLIPQQFNFGTGTWEDVPLSEPELLPSYVTLGYNLAGRERYYWKNRLRIKTSIDTSWSMNIEQFTDNSLDFSLTFSFFLYKFLELSVTTTSHNNRTFQYFPKLAAELGQPHINPIEDLLKSFNFFNVGQREESAFNLRSITVEAVHYLHDWNLTLSYEGKPILNEEALPNPRFEWGNTFSIILQWLPIPEVRSNIRGEEGTLSLRG